MLPDGRVCGAEGLVMDEAHIMLCADHAPLLLLMRLAIHRAMLRPDTYLAAALGEYMDDWLAAELDCAAEDVWQVRLARWPRVESWVGDTVNIARMLGCPPVRLDALLRRAAVRGRPLS